MTGPNSANRSIREVVELYLHAYRTGDVSNLNDIISPEFVDHTFSNFSGGPRGVARSIRALHHSFGEIVLSIEDWVHNADTAAVRVVTTAIHVGIFAGYAATGNKVTWYSCDFFRLRHGCITDLWSVQDTIALLRGVGALSS